MNDSYDLEGSWRGHLAAVGFIVLGWLGMCGYAIVTGDGPPWWFFAIGLVVGAFLAVLMWSRLIRSARLTADAVEVRTGRGSRRVLLTDVQRPSRLSRSLPNSQNIKTVTFRGGFFLIPGYSRPGHDLLAELIRRT